MRLIRAKSLTRNHSHETTHTETTHTETTHTNHSQSRLGRDFPVGGSRQRFHGGVSPSAVPVSGSRQRFPSAFPARRLPPAKFAKPLARTTHTNHSHSETTHTKPLTRTTHTNHSHVPSGSRPATRAPDGTRPRPDRLGDRVADPTTHKPLANH